MNDFGRTFFNAFSALCTFVGVDPSHIASHRNGAGFTLTYTERTSKTTSGTKFTYFLAAILSGTLYTNSLTFGNKTDHILGTNRHTGAAAYAFGFIHFCQAVFYMNGIEFTDLDASTETKAAVRTG